VIGAPTGRPDLAFKAYEIEEHVAVYLHRPLGMVAARAARAIGASPNILTLLAIVVGVTGGLLFAWPRLAVTGFLLLVLHGVLDSSDGQLARMTGQMSEFGRLLDGIAGFATHVAIYVGLLWGLNAAGSPAASVVLVLAAAAVNIVHAQLYDYYRTAYEKIGLKRRLSPGALAVLSLRDDAQPTVLALYERMARVFAGRHSVVEAAIARRAVDGAVTAADSTRYRALFYGPVRGWNLLGDNTRFYGLGVLALIGHLEWFPFLVLIGQNLAWAVVAVWQRRRDAAFLAS
jgi:phosphatidylglycerophosphate synthase